MRLFLSTLFALTTLFNAALFADNQTDPMTASAAAASNWLQLVDDGKYADSWATSSQQMQLVMSKGEWVKLLNAVRHPLGSVNHREIAQQRPAENPKGLAPGDYMVILYQTAFSNRPKGEELVTLSLGYDGKWRVLTYQVK